MVALALCPLAGQSKKLLLVTSLIVPTDDPPATYSGNYQRNIGCRGPSGAGSLPAIGEGGRSYLAHATGKDRHQRPCNGRGADGAFRPTQRRES